MDISHTTSGLLSALMDSQNQQVWSEFDARYRPVILGLAAKLGLSHADAEDAAQEALTRFVRSYRAGGYDRDRGRLRAWMAQIARNCITDVHRARAARREYRGESGFGQVPEGDDFAGIWDEECRRAIIDRSLSELRNTTRIDEKTLRAFKLVALQGRSPAEAAAELGLSVDSVYAAKSRCVKELRQIVERLNIAYELD